MFAGLALSRKDSLNVAAVLKDTPNNNRYDYGGRGLIV